MHEQHIRKTYKEHISKKLRNLETCVLLGSSERENRSIINSCQGGTVNTNYYKTKILKSQANAKCRFCLLYTSIQVGEEEEGDPKKDGWKMLKMTCPGLRQWRRQVQNRDK